MKKTKTRDCLEQDIVLTLLFDILPTNSTLCEHIYIKIKIGGEISEMGKELNLNAVCIGLLDCMDWRSIFLNVVFGTFNARKLQGNYSVVQEHRHVVLRTIFKDHLFMHAQLRQLVLDPTPMFRCEVIKSIT